MSYAARGVTGLGIMYATAGLGALGFDRWPAGTGSDLRFVTSLGPVRGLSGAAATSAAPGEVKTALQRIGLTNVGAGWASGGRIWVRYTTPGTGQWWAAGGQGAMESGPVAAYRRGQVREALTRAARKLGPQVTFALPDGTTVPVGVSTAASTVEESSATSHVVELAVTNVGALNDISALALQQLLLQKGFSVGPTGADGVWGDKSTSGFQRAIGGEDPDVRVSDDRRSVTVWGSYLAHIRALPNSAAPNETRVSPTRPAEQPPQEMVSGGGIKLEEWLPWAIGGAALLGLGAFFYFRKRPARAALATNRGRRRRRRR